MEIGSSSNFNRFVSPTPEIGVNTTDAGQQSVPVQPPNADAGTAARSTARSPIPASRRNSWRSRRAAAFKQPVRRLRP